MLTIKKCISFDDFPNELLDMIFKLIYQMHWKPDDGIFPGSWLGDPFAPSMFPFAQAKVCRRWCTLLAYHPIYWTRIPIVSNPATTPSHYVPNYLTWSQDLPIEVFLQSDPDAYNMGEIDVKSYVDVILPYISQHLYHTKTIKFSLSNTSIPNLYRWLVGPADILVSMELSPEGRAVTTAFPVLDYRSSSQEDGDQLALHFSAPELRSLSIDWRTFVNACRTDGTWLANTPKLSFFRLTSSGTSSPVDDMSVRATIQALSHSGRELSYISIRNIPFAEDDECLEFPAILSVQSMIFENLKGTEVATFVAASGGSFESMNIKNCSVLGLGDFLTYYLDLEDLDEEHNLPGLFGDIYPCRVSLCNCAAFNDTFLKFMANGGLTGEDFPARATKSLVLQDCTNFSVECLYRMIFARRRAKEASSEWDGTEEGLSSGVANELNAIAELQVIDGPLLSAEYREKFSQLVPGFYWD